jgi:hypothetical protein
MVGSIEDVAYAKQVNEIVVASLNSQCLLEHSYRLTEPVAFEVFIDAVNRTLDYRVTLHFFLCAFENEVDFFVLLARRVVLPTHRLLIPRYLLTRTPASRWRLVLFFFPHWKTTLAESFGVVFLLGFSSGLIEEVAVFGE